ncbi:MAG TPA: RdgB/HAM1 family non-canonical purine NTP pyrophosphatase [Bacteroidales bacterium]|nr:RdgB/HAM1 family non-canonical purine NTP pyrophosphatase [Bacteroidales bacterium]
MDLIIASNNSHKISEIKDVIDNSINLIPLAKTGIREDIPEKENTIKGNALAKAKYVNERTGSNVFADDTGLEVEALDGAPGVHSARYAGPGKNSDDNIEKLLDELKDKENRKARFMTVVALIYNNREYFFEGTIGGRIITGKRGKAGFGYDPVFIPDNEELTFAEMPPEKKNIISHRAIAVNKLKAFLNKLV